MGNNCIRKITPGGTVATFAGNGLAGIVDGQGAAARFNLPRGLTIDAAGNLYVADGGSNALRKITPGGMVTTIASRTGVFGSILLSDLYNPEGIAVAANGTIYFTDIDQNIRYLTEFGTAGVLAGAIDPGFVDGTRSAARFRQPKGLAIDAAGNVYVADVGNHSIRKITPFGSVSTLAGSGQPGMNDGGGAAAQFSFPQMIALDAGGNIYVTDLGNYRIRKVTPTGNTTTLAGSGVVGSLNGPLLQAQFDFPLGIAVNAAGDIYITEINSNKIRYINKQ
jgi:DNA-binding beta-propeller fold protein YncE